MPLPVRWHQARTGDECSKASWVWGASRSQARRPSAGPRLLDADIAGRQSPITFAIAMGRPAAATAVVEAAAPVSLLTSVALQPVWTGNARFTPAVAAMKLATFWALTRSRAAANTPSTRTRDVSWQIPSAIPSVMSWTPSTTKPAATGMPVTADSAIAGIASSGRMRQPIHRNRGNGTEGLTSPLLRNWCVAGERQSGATGARRRAWSGGVSFAQPFMYDGNASRLSSAVTSLMR